jgi:hypothetical protein
MATSFGQLGRRGQQRRRPGSRGVDRRPRRRVGPPERGGGGLASRRAQRVHGHRHRGHRCAGVVARDPHHGPRPGRRPVHPAESDHLPRPGAGVYRSHASRRAGRQRRRAVGGRRGHHRRYHVPRRAPPDQGRPRSLVEVHRDLLGRDRPGLLRHGARVPVCSARWRALRRRPRLDVAHGPRPSPRPLRAAARVRPRGPWLRHQGRPGPHAQLAARRPQPGPRPGLGPHVRSAAHGGLLRHLALQGGDRPRPRARVLPHLLVIVALLSLAVAASLLLTQRDYKRMLAYHSIEHMGLIALGAAAGIPLAIAAVLLHILGHGLAKSVLFLTSGEIMAAEGTSQIDGVRALLARRPCPRRGVRRGAGGVARAPAVQPLLQRAAHGPGRVRGRARLGRRRGRGRHGGYLRRRRRPRPPHAPRSQRPPRHWRRHPAGWPHRS